ncbi:MAG: GldG family protein [Acidobacteria bacterium]|nr:GldG family protein [Acidobacteriota bacterium]
MIAILVLMANYLGWKYHRRLDWTSSQIYSLSPKSLGVLADLSQDIDIVAFMSPGSELYSATTELLTRYDAASPRVSVRFVDTERNPAEAQALIERYEVTSAGTLIVESQGDRRSIVEADLAEYDYSMMQYGQPARITDFKGEQVLTSSILNLIDGRKPRILFTSGHGEAELGDPNARGLSHAQELLGRDNFEMETWPSLGQEVVPDGTDLIVVAGPRISFVEPELRLLDSFLDGGGRLILMLDPTLGDDGMETSGFDDWLRGRGVTLGRNVVVDGANKLPFYSAETFFANAYEDHPVTEALAEAQYPVIFSLARSVQASAEPVPGARVVELVRSSAGAWGETSLTRLDAVRKDAADDDGPLGLAVAVEIDDGRLVVFGDSDFATNAQLANGGNPTLLLNTLNWLVERENLLEIPPRQANQLLLGLTRSQMASVYWLVLVVLPGSCVALGVAVFLRRRR